jgi:hypothetical protein
MTQSTNQGRAFVNTEMKRGLTKIVSRTEKLLFMCTRSLQPRLYPAAFREIQFHTVHLLRGRCRQYAIQKTGENFFLPCSFLTRSPCLGYIHGDLNRNIFRKNWHLFYRRNFTTAYLFHTYCYNSMFASVRWIELSAKPLRYFVTFMSRISETGCP